MGTHRLGDRLLTEPIAIHIERYGWHGKLDCVHGREFDEHCNDCQRWVRMAECDHQYITADGSCERCKKPEVVKVTMKEGSRYHCKACGFNVFATTGPDRCTCASPENTWRLPGQPVSQEKNPPLKPPLCAMTLPRNVLEAAVSLRHACMAMNLELKAIGIEGAQESLLMGDPR
jgi:hypothetical protein